jgi:hypothetical protein
LRHSVTRRSRQHGGTSSKSKSSRQNILTGCDAFTRTKKTAGSMTSGLPGSQSLNRTICLCPGSLTLFGIRHVCREAFVSKVSRSLASPYLDRASDHCSIVAKVSHCGQTYFAIRCFDAPSADLVPLRSIFTCNPLVAPRFGPPHRSGGFVRQVACSLSGTPLTLPPGKR